MPVTGIASGELLFNRDTREIFVGVGEGEKPVPLTTVVEGPDGGLYHPTKDGYFPLCIRVPDHIKGLK